MIHRRPLLLGLGLAACGPGVDVPTPWSSRALLVVEPEGDPFELVSVDLVQAQGERRPHPVEQLAGLYSVSWVIDGEALLARTRDGGAWLSFEDEAEEPWPMYPVLPGSDVSTVVAPDGGHVAVLTTTSLDVPAFSIEVFDLRSRERVSRVLACTFGGSFEWVGQGPAFLASITECEDVGAVVSRSLVHVRPDLPHETLATHASVAPRVSSMSPDGRFAAIEVDDRWQLHQLSVESNAVVVLDQALDAERARETWSFDGSFMAHLDGPTMMVRNPTGTTHWSLPLAAPSQPLWSPRDTRFVTLERCDGTQRQLYLGDPQRDEVTSLGDCEGLASPMWTPDAESLVLATSCDPSYHVALEWLDLGTGERRRVAECGVWRDSLRWSPDGSTLALLHACDADRSRIRLLDARGIERAASPCLESWLGPWSPDSDMVSLVADPSCEDRSHAQLLHVDGGMLDLGPGYAGDWRPGSLR